MAVNPKSVKLNLRVRFLKPIFVASSLTPSHPHCSTDLTCESARAGREFIGVRSQNTLDRGLASHSHILGRDRYLLFANSTKLVHAYESASQNSSLQKDIHCMGIGEWTRQDQAFDK